MKSSVLDKRISSGNSWITKYGHSGPEITELISGKTKIADLQLVCINLLEKQIDLAWDLSTWHSRMQSQYLKDLVELSRQKARKQNIKVRMITEIIKDSIPSINALSPGFEIRHLTDLKGNFEILDSRQYFVYLPNTSDDNLAQVMYSNVRQFVEQQQQIFNSLWKKAIPADHRINEIERGSSPGFVEVVRDLNEITEVAKELIETSDLEIQIFASDMSKLLIIFTPSLLQKLISGALKRGIEIRVLFENRTSKSLTSMVKPSLSNSHQIGHHGDFKKIFEHIPVRYTSKSSELNQVRIVKDNRSSFVIEMVDGGFRAKSKVQTGSILVATYSNNASTAWANVSIFEMMWNNSTYTNRHGERLTGLRAGKSSELNTIRS